MKKQFIMPTLTGLVAVLLAIADFFIAKIVYPGRSFLWVSFICWAAFTSVSLKERFYDVLCLISGFLVAFLMGILTLSLDIFLKITILSSLFSIFIFNLLIVYVANHRKFSSNLVTAIFIGLALSFSGLGVNLNFNTLSDSFLMLLIIIIYGALGLLAGFCLNKMTKKFG